MSTTELTPGEVARPVLRRVAPAAARRRDPVPAWVTSAGRLLVTASVPLPARDGDRPVAGALRMAVLRASRWAFAGAARKSERVTGTAAARPGIAVGAEPKAPAVTSIGGRVLASLPAPVRSAARGPCAGGRALRTGAVAAEKESLSPAVSGVRS